MSEEQPPKKNSSYHQISAAERGIALALAVAVLVTFIVLVLYPRAMDGGTLAVVRFLAATFAGIAGYLFAGNLDLEAKIPLNKTQVRATGAFAAFVLVLFLFFVGVPVSSSPLSSTSLRENEGKLGLRDSTANNINLPVLGQQRVIVETKAIREGEARTTNDGRVLILVKSIQDFSAVLSITTDKNSAQSYQVKIGERLVIRNDSKTYFVDILGFRGNLIDLNVSPVEQKSSIIQQPNNSLRAD